MLNILKRKEPLPNVVMICLDGLRLDRIMNAPAYKRLLDKGTIFSEMITYAPYTIASLHAIFSGAYGASNGVNAYYKHLSFNKDKYKTLTQQLKASGYYCIADVINPKVLPVDDFDEKYIQENILDDSLKRHKEFLLKVKKSKRHTFCYLHYSQIHNWLVKDIVQKYDVNDENFFKQKKENIARYDRLAEDALTYLSGLLDIIEQEKMCANTLFIIFSDHGASTGERNGERLYGVFTYDYSIKIFCSFIYDKAIPRNKDIQFQVRSIDIMRTIFDILKIRTRPVGNNIELGESLMDFITSQEQADRLAFCETGGLEGPNPSPYEPNIKCIRTKDWKYIRNLTTGKSELYDLKADKNEEHNLSGKKPFVEADLFKKMLKFC